MRGMDLGSAALDGSVFLDWWTGVVLLAPDEVPDGGDEYEGEEDNGGVVHGFGCDGEVRWHAEEGHSESGPGWWVLAGGQTLIRGDTSAVQIVTHVKVADRETLYPCGKHHTTLNPTHRRGIIRQVVMRSMTLCLRSNFIARW